MYMYTCMYTHFHPIVDIRRVVLAGGVNVSVIVRAGESYLLKVELPSILPSHSRDVLETIRRVNMYMYVSLNLSTEKSNGAFSNGFNCYNLSHFSFLSQVNTYCKTVNVGVHYT